MVCRHDGCSLKDSGDIHICVDLKLLTNNRVNICCVRNIVRVKDNTNQLHVCLSKCLYCPFTCYCPWKYISATISHCAHSIYIFLSCVVLSKDSECKS